jgi:hypothetical protein
VSTTGVISKTYSARCKYQYGPFGWRHYAILYAIEAPAARKFKIGRTTDIEKRFGSLCTMSPVPLVLRGHLWLPDEAEAEAHIYLAEHRSHGEWFDAHQMVIELVELIQLKKVMKISALLEMDRMLLTVAENAHNSV